MLAAAGKTACSRAPALLLPGLTVAVSFAETRETINRSEETGKKSTGKAGEVTEDIKNKGRDERLSGAYRSRL